MAKAQIEERIAVTYDEVLEQTRRNADKFVWDTIRSVDELGRVRMLMPLLRAAPKWDAAVYLLEGLTDADEKVRTVASTLLDGWLDDFNRSQVTPDAAQMIRIRQLLDLVGGQLSTEAMRLMRLSIASR